MNLVSKYPPFSALCKAVLVCAFVVAGHGLAHAQQDEQTPAVSAPLASSSYLTFRKQVYDIVILGDVLGTGLWAGLNRVADVEDRITVTARIQENSGLARPKLYNWQKAVTALLQSRKFDIAAVMLGANDGRDIRTADGVLKLGTPEWQVAYGDRITALVKALREQGVAVYWFGVPPMAKPSYNEAMQVVADVERQVMANLGVRYIDLQLLLEDADGGYTDSGDDGTGEITRLRSRNGIKFITRGNDRLAAELMQLVRADIAAADGGPVVASEQKPVNKPVTLTPEQLAALPSFAAERLDGEVVTSLAPASLPGPDYVEVARVDNATANAAKTLKGSALFGLTRGATAPDSAARKLFLEGIWPDAPEGRFDTFMLPDAGQAASDN